LSEGKDSNKRGDTTDTTDTDRTGRIRGDSGREERRGKTRVNNNTPTTAVHVNTSGVKAVASTYVCRLIGGGMVMINQATLMPPIRNPPLFDLIVANEQVYAIS
jgi:hypothetical protein